MLLCSTERLCFASSVLWLGWIVARDASKLSGEISGHVAVGIRSSIRGMGWSGFDIAAKEHALSSSQPERVR
jgi:hypothetical protein